MAESLNTIQFIETLDYDSRPLHYFGTVFGTETTNSYTGFLIESNRKAAKD